MINTRAVTAVGKYRHIIDFAIVVNNLQMLQLLQFFLYVCDIRVGV